MSRPTAIVVDDEPGLVAELVKALAATWPDLEIAGTAHDGARALALAEALHPDVAFLDIQMPGPSGLEVARRLAGRCHVVFVTAFDRYALDAFDSAAADYLLKPVNGDRLGRTVERLRARLASPPADLGALVEKLAERLRPGAGALEWLQVQERDDVVLVAVDEVDVFQSADKYTVALSGDREWVIRTPLKELEARLDPARFWRVHRSAIVRVAAIARVSRDLGGQLTVHLKASARTVGVSRAHAARFKEM
ncbi:MAG TPA: LytTR family DNA-binding domain-containing protein [Anaeromyxobacteraceae bacterium]|nr:LytTR family DNA-binding domain-containing protein [Anaeromyxobacteraceae bacterium]